MMPVHIKPVFETNRELLAQQKEQGTICSIALECGSRVMKVQRTFSHSDIHPLYQNCSFENYRVGYEGQASALSEACQYIGESDGNIVSFTFSGKPGTGKNHLTVAICNEPLLRGKSVLIITVVDTMSTMKDTFRNSGINEEQLPNDLSNVDLPVIDEIDVQTEPKYKKMIISQIVDRHSSSRRPARILTNSNMREITKSLGERAINRIRLDNSLWVVFSQDGHRSRVTDKEY